MKYIRVVEKDDYFVAYENKDLPYMAALEDNSPRSISRGKRGENRMHT